MTSANEGVEHQREAVEARVVHVVLDDLAHADPHVDRDVDEQQGQRDPDQRVADGRDQRRVVGGRRGVTTSQTRKARNSDVERAGQALHA